eukprot:6374364-Alexandrium_andersonii.AAC.1
MGQNDAIVAGGTPCSQGCGRPPDGGNCRSPHYATWCELTQMGQNAKSLQEFETGTAWSQDRPQIPPQTVSSGGSASFCALNPMVKAKRAGGRAGGA